MRCPKCLYEKQRVVDTSPCGEETYRKRVCLTCGHTFITYEKYHSEATYKPRESKNNVK